MKRGTALRAAGTAFVLALAALLALRGDAGCGGTSAVPTPEDARGTADPGGGPPAASSRGVARDDGRSIRGIVVDAAGAPVPGAEVAASREGRPRPVRAAAAADGRFLLPGLDPDTDYLLGARAEGFAPEVRSGVRAGDDVRLVLRLPIRLMGRVLSPEGAPRPGARVRVLLLYPGLAEPLGGMEVRADEEGRYSFAGLPAVPGEAEASWQGTSSGPRRYGPPAEAGGGVDLDIVLDAGPAIAGRVLGEDGRPLPGMVVSAGVPGGAVRLCTTREDGTFEIAGLAAAPLRVSARDPDRRYREERTEGVVPPRDGLAFVLRRDPDAPGRVVFRCTDSDGRPVAGLSLETFREGADRPAGLASARADRDGAFRPAPLAAGRYRFVLSRGAEAVAVEGVAVEPGGVADLGTIRLAPGTLLRGRVVLEEGGSPTEALVLVGDSPFPERDAADAEGRLALRALPPGRGTIRVLHPRCEPLVVPWAAGPGETADLGDLRLRPARGAVRGAVRPAGGPIPAGTAVRLRREDVVARDGLDREAAPSPDGRFEFLAVPSGRWRVSAAVPVAESEHARFTAGVAGPEVLLAEGEQREVEVVVPTR